MIDLAPPDARIKLVIFEWWAAAVAGLIVFVWAAIVYLGATTCLLRDPGPPGTDLARRTFSLAKVQVAWWFSIIFAAFVLLWLVTGETPALNGQALSLFGLSGATSLAAAGVAADRSHDDGRVGVFFHDLLSDQQGITIHRFQMLVLTVTLGLAFLVHVARHLIMPEFEPSLLVLMGISSATYVGMKIPEQARAEAGAGSGAGAGAGGKASNDDPKAGPSVTPVDAAASAPGTSPAGR